MTDDAQHIKDRSATYDRMLLLAKQHVDALPLAIVTDLHSLSPTAAATDAKRESWRLLARGIQHLKDGAPNGDAGAVSGAIEKASLRNSSLAQTLGVKPPTYEAAEFDMPFFQSGQEEAIFFAARLSEALLGDLDTSKVKITEKLATANPAQAFGSDADSAQLQKIFDAVKSGNGTPVVPQRDLVDLRKQTILSFNYLNDAYAETMQAFKAELNNLPELPRPQRPHAPSKSFDL
ncbi:MAG: hypothetical protein PSY14_14705 [bacterium]|nr:hypothetical protein [bacterium]